MVELSNLLKEVYSNPYALGLTVILCALTFYIHSDTGENERAKIGNKAAGVLSVSGEEGVNLKAPAVAGANELQGTAPATITATSTSTVVKSPATAAAATTTTTLSTTTATTTDTTTAAATATAAAAGTNNVNNDTGKAGDKEDKFVRAERERIKKGLLPTTPTTPTRVAAEDVSPFNVMAVPNALVYGLTFGAVNLFHSPDGTTPTTSNDSSEASPVHPAP